MLTICREDAVALCGGLNFATAGGWRRRRLTGKLVEFIEMDNDLEGGLGIDEEAIEDKDERERLNSLLGEVLTSGGEIEVTEEREEKRAEAEEVNEEPETEEQSDDPVEDVEDSIPVNESYNQDESHPKLLDNDEEESEPKKKKSAKKPKAEPTKSVKTRGRCGPVIDGSPVGIRSIRNRLFMAGQILKAHGLSDGLSEELVGELDELSDNSNPKASKTQLGWAWHAINGYLNGEEEE